MRLTLLRFHWLRFFGAIVALLLALLYLYGYEQFSLIGFALIALVLTYGGIRIRRGTLPAICDLCGAHATMTSEYGAGFSNARLIICCPDCGRIVNGSNGGVQPRKE